MSNYAPTPEGKDPEIWELAKNRVEFKSHFFTYVVINAFLWALWYFTAGRYMGYASVIPWPLWVTLGWGLGLLMHFSKAYLFHKSNSIEHEYEKLKGQSNKK